MRSDLIVDLPPFFDEHFRFSQRVELVAVQATAPKCAVETLARTVVPRLSRIAVHQLNTLRCQPRAQVVRDKLAASITTNVGRHAVAFEQSLQHVADIATVEPVTRLDRQGQRRGFVLDRQAANCAARGVGIVDEVVAPHVIAEPRLRCQPLARDHLAARRSGRLLQLRLLPQSMHALAIDLPAALANMAMSQSITPVRILHRNPLQPRQQLGVLARSDRLIVQRGTRHAEQPAAAFQR